MSVLVILMPPRPRPRTDAAARAPAEYAFVLGSDGGQVMNQGRAAASELPRADHACLLLADADVAWHRVLIPKAPTARRRAALAAVLEEQLLEDDEVLHLALEPAAAGGQEGWVAVTRMDALVAAVAELGQAGVALERIAPSSWPQASPALHLLPAAADDPSPTLVHSHPGGVACLRLAGSLARQRIAALDHAGLRCTAHPQAVAEAERWLGSKVQVIADAERMLQALASPWNLRQFELAPRRRSVQRLRDFARRLRADPDWRPVRLGLSALVLVQLVGLNAWAWKLEHELRGRQQAQVRLLQDSHPQVRAVLDAPQQMLRETERLRLAAGQRGSGDLEPMLDAAARAWPEGQGPLQALQFEPGQLAITAAAWDGALEQGFAERLRALGYQVQRQGSQILIRTAGPA